MDSSLTIPLLLWKFPARNEGPVWWRHDSVLTEPIVYYYGEKFDMGLNKNLDS